MLRVAVRPRPLVVPTPGAARTCREGCRCLAAQLGRQAAAHPRPPLVEVTSPAAAGRPVVPLTAGVAGRPRAGSAELAVVAAVVPMVAGSWFASMPAHLPLGLLPVGCSLANTSTSQSLTRTSFSLPPQSTGLSRSLLRQTPMIVSALNAGDFTKLEIEDGVSPIREVRKTHSSISRSIGNRVPSALAKTAAGSDSPVMTVSVPLLYARTGSLR